MKGRMKNIIHYELNVVFYAAYLRTQQSILNVLSKRQVFRDKSWRGPKQQS